MSVVPYIPMRHLRHACAIEPRQRIHALHSAIPFPGAFLMSALLVQDGPADDAAVNGEQEGAEQAEEEAADNLSDVSSGADEADEEEVPNHCISQFTKVTRAKNRWKAQLTAGILHLNGRDHVFSAANGDMEF